MKNINILDLDPKVPVPAAIFYLKDSNSLLVVGTNAQTDYSFGEFSNAIAAANVPLAGNLRRKLWLFDDDDDDFFSTPTVIKNIWPQAARFDEQKQCAVAAAVQGESYFGFSPSWNSLVVSKFNTAGSLIGQNTISFSSISSAYSTEVISGNYFVHSQLDQLDGGYAVFQFDQNLNQVAWQYFDYQPTRQTNPELFGPEIDVTKATLSGGELLQLNGNSIQVITQKPTRLPTQAPQSRAPTLRPTFASGMPITNYPTALLPQPPAAGPSPNPPSNHSSANHNQGLAIGLSLGLMLLAVTALYFGCKMRQKSRNQSKVAVDGDVEMQETVAAIMKNPDEFIDPIFYNLMTDPVANSSGQTYQRESIEEHFQSRRTKHLGLTDPLTNTPLANEELTPNQNLKNEIEQYVNTTRTKAVDLAEKFIKLGKNAEANQMIERIEGLNAQFKASDQFNEKFTQTKAKLQNPSSSIVGANAIGLQREGVVVERS